MINTDVLSESNNLTCDNTNFTQPNPNYQEQGLNSFNNHDYLFNNREENILIQSRPTVTATSALGLLLQSSKFKEMMEMTSAADLSVAPLLPAEESRSPPCSFPDDIQTFFECEDSNEYGGHGDHGTMFNELSSLVPPVFHYDDFETWSGDKKWLHALKKISDNTMICLLIYYLL